MPPSPRSWSGSRGADHFFQGIPGSPGSKLERMQAEMRLWLSEEFGLS